MLFAAAALRGMEGMRLLAQYLMYDMLLIVKKSMAVMFRRVSPNDVAESLDDVQSLHQQFL